MKIWLCRTDNGGSEPRYAASLFEPDIEFCGSSAAYSSSTRIILESVRIRLSSSTVENISKRNRCENYMYDLDRSGRSTNE